MSENHMIRSPMRRDDDIRAGDNDDDSGAGENDVDDDEDDDLADGDDGTTRHRW